MNIGRPLALAAVSLLLSLAPASAPAATPCTPDKAAILVAAIDESCACEPDVPWGKHRFYRTCTRRRAREVMREHGREIPRTCLKAVLRCGLLSTCGEDKPRFTCSTFGASARCSDGVCASDPSMACTTNTDCADAGNCAMVDSIEKCTGSGGFAGTGSCCSPEVLATPAPEPTPAP